MKNKLIKALYGAMAAAMFAGVLTPMTVLADGYTGWKEEDGKLYWYENDVKQGYDANNLEYRGKEIYDPGTNAWYWLDNVQGGAKAVSKDVYQESQADDAGNMGKWVRYDANGLMIKGWSTNENGTYYFDPVYGTMIKGWRNINGVDYRFDDATGVLQESTGGVEGNANGWRVIDGVEYWYENGVRQGTEGRGKEIYDPGTNAWYWLDAIDGGKKAVSKDVYQESEAGAWADREDGTGKWVRYDASGHMIKGWSTNENGTYYFDPIYGTMAKGIANIDGVNHKFDVNTGIYLGEVQVSTRLSWRNKEYYQQNADGTYRSRTVYEHNANGKTVKSTSYVGNNVKWVEKDGSKYADYYYSNSKEEMLISSEYTYEYDATGERTKRTSTSYSFNVDENGIRTPYKYAEHLYTYKNGEYSSSVSVYYNSDGSISSKYETTYDDRGNETKDLYYRVKDGELQLYRTYTYEYDGNGYLAKEYCDYADESYTDSVTEYVCDAEGNVLTMTQYEGGEKTYVTNYTYQNGNLVWFETVDVSDNHVAYREEIDYDANGNKTEQREFYDDYNYDTDTYELVLNYKYTYEYNANGSETLRNSYDYDYNYETESWEENHNSYAVTTYVNIGNYEYTKEYDSYSGHYRYGEDGKVVWSSDDKDPWAYSYGYAYEYNENGSQTQYYSYTNDENYQKVLSYRTENYQMNRGKAEQVGQTYIYTSGSTFDKDNNKQYDTIYEYEVYERTYTN